MDSKTASGLANVAGGLAADSRSLEQLKRTARDDPRQAVKKAATQFEALYMQMVLKSMREATLRSGMLDSQEQDLYRGMLDQQIAQQIAASGTGLSDLIARQLSRSLVSSAKATEAGTASAAQVSAAAAGEAPAAKAVPPPTGNQREFMQQHWGDAMRAQDLTGVPASFILGQAGLESGWGRREIRAADGQPSHNLFGIKAGPGWQGRTVQVATTEYDGGVPQQSVQSFRAYDSYAAAFQDWALTIGRSQRYSAAVVPGAGAGSFAAGMQQAGYSTDPNYAQKLQGAIRTASAIGEPYAQRLGRLIRTASSIGGAG